MVCLRIRDVVSPLLDHLRRRYHCSTGTGMHGNTTCNDNNSNKLDVEADVSKLSWQVMSTAV